MSLRETSLVPRCQEGHTHVGLFWGSYIMQCAHSTKEENIGWDLGRRLGAKVTVTCCSSCFSYKYRFSWDVGYYGDGGRVALNLEGNKKCCYRLLFPCCAVTFPLLLPNHSLPTQPLAAMGLLPTVPASPFPTHFSPVAHFQMLLLWLVPFRLKTS